MHSNNAISAFSSGVLEPESHEANLLAANALAANKLANLLSMTGYSLLALSTR